MTTREIANRRPKQGLRYSVIQATMKESGAIRSADGLQLKLLEDESRKPSSDTLVETLVY